MDNDLLQIRTGIVNFYVLRDSKGLYLIDGGFIGARRRLKKALSDRGWDREPLLGIILTHGHLDHILNVKNIADEYGAWIAAPRMDLDYYRGQSKYTGISKLTGALESLGRSILNFQPFEPDRLLDSGDELDIYGGLLVVSLPGHTKGHIGFYSEKRKLLFSGDLFASFGKWTHLPPTFFNSDDAEISKSISKALELDLEGVFPNHCDKSKPDVHLSHLRKLSRKL